MRIDQLFQVTFSIDLKSNDEDEVALLNSAGRSWSITYDKFKRLHAKKARTTLSNARRRKVKIVETGFVHDRYRPADRW